MDKLYDVACRECPYVEEMWLNEDDVDDICQEQVMCGVCTKGVAYISLGTPQFNLKGQGYYKPGKS